MFFQLNLKHFAGEIADRLRAIADDLDHGRAAIGYFPRQRSEVTEDFAAGRLEAEPPTADAKP